jgi:TatA/E family protein of Tat protein translocase
MFGLGFGELILIFLIALIFIGPKKLPELAKGLGQGIKEFQKAAKGLTDQLQDNEDTNANVPKVADTTAKQQQEPTPIASNLDDKDRPQS